MSQRPICFGVFVFLAVLEGACYRAAQESTNRPPKVDIVSSSRSVPPGGVILLTARVSDPDGDQLLYRWGADKGRFRSKETSSAVWQAPNQPGTAVVSFTVSDSKGAATTTPVVIQVEVSPLGFEEMPQFRPWPPPMWTSRHVIPRRALNQGSSSTLGDLADQIELALLRAQISDWSVYAVGTNGFAVVARMERIHDDGTPFSGPQRWGLELKRDKFDLAGYIRRLLRAEPGRYRIIVILSTSRSLRADRSVSAEEIKPLPTSGAGQLSPELRERHVPPSRRCEALIYEFFKAAADDPARHLTSTQTRITALKHLVGAGLWTALELEGPDG